MTEPTDGLPAAAEPTSAETRSPSAAPRRRSATPWILLLLAAVLAAGFWAWREQQTRQGSERRLAEWQQQAEALQARIDALDGELAGVRERQRSIEARIGENAAAARVIREEVLAVGSRAAAVEDALGRLAQQGERADQNLRLNEIDFLLQLGEQRWRLFADPASAQQALAMAEAALQALDLPALASVQAAIGAEREQLAALPADPRPPLRARLDSLGEQLRTLPAPAQSGLATAADDRDRLWQALSRLVSVRRIDDSQLVLSPIERASRLAALQLQWVLARAALGQPDATAWRQAIVQAGQLAAGLFDDSSAGYAQLQRFFSDASAADWQPPRVELGGALRELRALRAASALPAPAPASAVLEVE